MPVSDDWVGECPECGEEFRGNAGPLRRGLHRKREHGVQGVGPKGKRIPPPGEGEIGYVSNPERKVYVPADEVSEIYATAETMPTDPAEGKKATGVFGRFWGGNKEPKGNGNGHGSVPETTEKRPTVNRRRVSTASFWGDLVNPASALVGRAGYVPMARAMAWSAPVTGEIIEDATRGTVVDKLVQPVVRNTEKWNDLFDLIGFWAAIGVAQRNPAQAPTALTFARARLVNLLPRIAANIKKERAKERAAVEALTELMPDIRELFPEAGPDDDPVGLLIESLFAAPAQPMETADV